MKDLNGSIRDLSCLFLDGFDVGLHGQRQQERQLLVHQETQPFSFLAHEAPELPLGCANLILRTDEHQLAEKIWQV